jgi:hypothetical protein
MDNIPDYTVDLTIEDIRLMHQCIEYRIKYWEGSPARPPEEQEHLWKVRDALYAMMLDYTFHNL